MDAAIDSTMFRARYANVFDGDARWQAVNVVASDTYQWRTGSTYVANPPYFEGMNMTPAPVSDIIEAKQLAIFADSNTTDHIRSEERRVGQECVGTFRSRGWPDHKHTQQESY